MKIVSITEMRQDATKLIEHVRACREPILVVQRSKPAAYLVDAREFEAMQAELKRLRHEQFWQEVAEAEAEYRAGKVRAYTDAEALIAAVTASAAPNRCPGEPASGAGRR